MQLSVSFRNLDPSDHLKNYAETRLARIKKYMEEPIDVHVVSPCRNSAIPPM